jgi:hypothetical protein
MSKTNGHTPESSLPALPPENCIKALMPLIDGGHVLDLQCALKDFGYGDVGQELVDSDNGDSMMTPCKAGECAIALVLQNNSGRVKIKNLAA